ncbi:MAG: hypothetical protein FWE60_04455, partial [Oscillospiraceae bacterium]|nr:hypothetical protein [Oscillospiraceae bacterium]
MYKGSVNRHINAESRAAGIRHRKKPLNGVFPFNNAGICMIMHSPPNENNAANNGRSDKSGGRFFTLLI